MKHFAATKLSILCLGLLGSSILYTSAAQTIGAPAAIYITNDEVMQQLDEAARNSTSAAGVSVTIA